MSEQEEEWASKTRMKKQVSDLQDLGMELTKLPPDTLKKIGLDEELLEAVLAYREITSNGALKRQGQLIDHLMHDTGPAPIEAFLAKLRGDSATHNAFLQRIEQACDRLLVDDDAVTQFMADFPHADAGKLRILIRNMKKGQEQNKPPKSFRALFQETKTMVEGSGAEGMDGIQDWAEQRLDNQGGNHLRKGFVRCRVSDGPKFALNDFICDLLQELNMLYKKLLLVSTFILFVFSASYGTNGHGKYSEIQQPTLKGKRNMSNLNLMLDEVFKIRVTDISSQRADVSRIVSKCICSDTSRHEINSIVSDRFDILENSNNELLIHYKKSEGNLGNRRDLYIGLFLDRNGNLLGSTSYLDKSSNL